jgi:hypothetical protein
MATYSDELAERLCAEIASGRSVRDICDTEDWAPSEKSIYLWIRLYPETFGLKYALAKQAQQDAELENIIAIADASTPETVQVDRLRIDTRKWAMARLAPKKYSDRLAIGGSADMPPIQTQSVTRIDLSCLSLDELDVLEKVLRQNGALLPREIEDAELTAD